MKKSSELIKEIRREGTEQLQLAKRKDETSTPPVGRAKRDFGERGKR